MSSFFACRWKFRTLNISKKGNFISIYFQQNFLKKRQVSKKKYFWLLHFLYSFLLGKKYTSKIKYWVYFFHLLSNLAKYIVILKIDINQNLTTILLKKVTFSLWNMILLYQSRKQTLKKGLEKQNSFLMKSYIFWITKIQYPRYVILIEKRINIK